MLNTSASGSARPVVSTTIISGASFSMISVTAASNSPSNEQQTQPPPSSKRRNTHVFSFNHFRVDGDLAEFIHHDCNLRRPRGKDVP